MPIKSASDKILNGLRPRTVLAVAGIESVTQNVSMRTLSTNFFLFSNLKIDVKFQNLDRRICIVVVRDNFFKFKSYHDSFGKMPWVT